MASIVIRVGVTVVPFIISFSNHRTCLHSYSPFLLYCGRRRSSFLISLWESFTSTLGSLERISDHCHQYRTNAACPVKYKINLFSTSLLAKVSQVCSSLVLGWVKICQRLLLKVVPFFMEQSKERPWAKTNTPL